MLKISFNEQKDSYEICYNGFSWVNDGRESFVSVRKKDGKKRLYNTLKGGIYSIFIGILFS